jgi:uncharacterized membrane protein
MKRIFALPTIFASLCVLTPTSQLKADGNDNLTFTSIDFPGSIFTSAHAINSAGQIVGRYTDAEGTNHGWLLSGGEFTTIDFPDAAFTGATEINAAGDIVGLYKTVVSGPFHGFLLRGGEFTSIDFPDSTGTSATGINARGDIVGGYCDGTIMLCPFGGLGNHGYLLNGDAFATIDFPGASITEPWKVNSRGEVVGFYVDTIGMTHGYLRSSGEFTSIDFPGAADTEALGINSSGEIVGGYCFAPCDPTGIIGHHGFELRDGQFTTIDFPGALFTRAFAISSRGEIVGAYRDVTNRNHGLLISKGADEEINDDKE